MSRRKSIRINTIVPEYGINDVFILKCSVNTCLLNSFYQCNFCKSYVCLKHGKKIHNNQLICCNCIINNRTICDIACAVEITKVKKNNWKEKIKYIISMQWIYCKNKK